MDGMELSTLIEGPRGSINAGYGLVSYKGSREDGPPGAGGRGGLIHLTKGLPHDTLIQAVVDLIGYPEGMKSRNR